MFSRQVLYWLFGMIACLLLFFLAFTGLILNHSKELGLNRHYLTWLCVLNYYDLNSKQADAVYLLNQKVVSQFGRQIFIDTTPVILLEDQLLGGINLDDIIVVATSKALFLFDSKATFIERIDSSADGLPFGIENIGLFHGQPVVQTGSGLWRGDIVLESWQNLSIQGVAWSKQQAMPVSIKKELSSYFYNEGVTIEKFLTDLHSGVILKSYGAWLLDIWWLFLLVFAMSCGLSWLFSLIAYLSNAS